ncbi:MAG: hypothetical protein DMG57_41645 [Acidobacteria bacterium]|nr:MAG: hypothetical protein DMG57_41645 [Acidobacteriota bacterium]
MRRWGTTWPAALLLALAGRDAICQVPSSTDTSTEIRKEWELGRSAGDRQTMDGSINDPAILEYLRQLAGRLTSAAGVSPIQIRLTRSNGQYSFLRTNRVLFISAGLLKRIEDEAEFSGLLAHELAHLTQGQRSSLSRGVCVLASPIASSSTGDLREREQHATTVAISYLKAAGYDPTGLLNFLSKLAYEHPVWATAIASEDLLDLRVGLEGETVPQSGYRIDSSKFIEVHSTLEATLGRIIDRAALASRPVLSRRR